MKPWLQDSNTKLQTSSRNEGKSCVAERFMRTLKDKIYKYTTEISNNVYIDKSADIVNKYNNSYHSTTKKDYNAKIIEFTGLLTSVENKIPSV